MKLELTDDTKIAIWKIGNAALMLRDDDITSAKYEEIALEAMNEANDANLKSSSCNIPLVSNNEVAVCEHLHRTEYAHLGKYKCEDCGKWIDK